MKKPIGYTLWEGDSKLDGKPVVVIATGFANKSKNIKTGDMIQTWILRQDIAPVQALSSGDDVSICGDCIHRPALGGDCYVSVGRAPQTIFRAWERGAYPALTDHTIFANKSVRFGSYGDPAAVPFEVWADIKDACYLSTGYTHQWRTCDIRFASLAMASADSEAEKEIANSEGWRTFRVKSPDQPTLPNEIVCPASDEGGKRMQCVDCTACRGLSALKSAKRQFSVVIDVHGIKKGKIAYV